MGLTVLDAGVLIAFLDSGDVHHQASRREFTAVRTRGDRLVVPASAFAETLVAPARMGEPAIGAVRDFVARLPLVVEPLDAAIAVVAARLRARHGTRLKLPDALVIGTAIHLSADTLVTSDRRWPARRDLGFKGRLIKL